MAKHFIDVQERQIWMLIQFYHHEKSIWSLLKHFTPADFNWPAKIHPLLLIKLDCARWEATRLRQIRNNDQLLQVPFVVTSDHRPGDPKAHGENPSLAVDLSCKKETAENYDMTEAQYRWYILQGLLAVGFNRVGHYAGDLHLHADIGDYIKPSKYPVDRNWVHKR